MPSLEFIEKISLACDQMANVPHHWGKWSYMTDYDAIQRKCICGVEQRITGILLNQLNQDPQATIPKLEYIWLNTPDHNAEKAKEATSGLEKLLQTAFPGAEEVMEEVETEPLELTDEHIANIVQWLEKPYHNFDHHHEYWEMMVAVRGHQEVMTELADIGAIHTGYTVVLIRRVPVVFADNRWWIDVARRVDTGEPLATVNHQGNYFDYQKEMGYE
jgi:hypothetical protein